MSLFDILNSQKDAAALDQVIDHAAAALTAKIVPAIQAAGDEMIDRLATRLQGIIHDSLASATKDAEAISGKLSTDVKTTIGELTALLQRLDGAQVKLTLAEPPK